MQCKCSPRIGESLKANQRRTGVEASLPSVARRSDTRAYAYSLAQVPSALCPWAVGGTVTAGRLQSARVPVLFACATVSAWVRLLCFFVCMQLTAPPSLTNSDVIIIKTALSDDEMSAISMRQRLTSALHSARTTTAGLSCFSQRGIMTREASRRKLSPKPAAVMGDQPV